LTEFPLKPKPLTKGQRQELIDEFGRLQQQVDAHKPAKARHAAIREQLLATYASAPPLQPYIEEGLEFTVLISERATERIITNMAKLLKMLGVRLFLKSCKFPLGAVDQAVPKAEHKLFLIEGPTGERRLKAVPKAAVRAAA